MEVSLRYVATDIGIYNGIPVAAGNKPSLCFHNDHAGKVILNDELEFRVVDMHPRDIEASALVRFKGQKYPIELYLDRVKQYQKPWSLEASLLASLALNPPTEFPDPEAPTSEPEAPKATKTKAERVPREASPIAALATKYEVDGATIRKFLRSQGLRAPYEEKAVNAAMKGFKKWLKNKNANSK